jgi:hypothetical protein
MLYRFCRILFGIAQNAFSGSGNMHELRSSLFPQRAAETSELQMSPAILLRALRFARWNFVPPCVPAATTRGKSDLKVNLTYRQTAKAATIYAEQKYVGNGELPSGGSNHEAHFA